MKPIETNPYWAGLVVELSKKDVLEYASSADSDASTTVGRQGLLSCTDSRRRRLLIRGQAPRRLRPKLDAHDYSPTFQKGKFEGPECSLELTQEVECLGIFRIALASKVDDPTRVRLA